MEDTHSTPTTIAYSSKYCNFFKEFSGAANYVWLVGNCLPSELMQYDYDWVAWWLCDATRFPLALSWRVHYRVVVLLYVFDNSSMSSCPLHCSEKRYVHPPITDTCHVDRVPTQCSDRPWKIQYFFSHNSDTNRRLCLNLKQKGHNELGLCL